MNWPELLRGIDAACIAAFGVDTQYRPDDGEPIEVRGIFMNPYRRADASHAGVSSSSPAVFYRLADLPGNPDEHAAEVAVDGATYRVTDVQPDGDGGVLLLLHKTG